MGEARAKKIADRIREIVASLLEFRVKDPRLGFVTVTEVRLTGDLREATVFYTVMGSETERLGSAAALESAKGMIRSEVGKQLGIKFTPTIEFVLDALPEGVARMEELLQQARAADEQVHQIAEKATWAGEADPYRDLNKSK
jgi:ribosome-binding factor A